MTRFVYLFKFKVKVSVNRNIQSICKLVCFLFCPGVVLILTLQLSHEDWFAVCTHPSCGMKISPFAHWKGLNSNYSCKGFKCDHNMRAAPNIVPPVS